MYMHIDEYEKYTNKYYVMNYSINSFTGASEANLLAGGGGYH